MKRDHVTTHGLRIVRGGTPEAKEWYAKMFWDTNDDQGLPVDVSLYPLDVVIASRVKAPQRFFVNDPEYQATAKTYKLIRNSCIVCDEKGSIMAVFVTASAIPEMHTVAEQGRIALMDAKGDLKPKISFTKGGQYMTYKDDLEKNNLRMEGSLWNDGLQTYTRPSKVWGGMFFTQYHKRRPKSDMTNFVLPYTGMYAIESAVVPAIARQRLRIISESKLPSAFPGVPHAMMPATQVGISENFSVMTHSDSCSSCVTESIFWANHNVRNGRFAVTSLEIAFDIGSQPCMLFQKGNEMHGTVPGAHGSCGLVLISKRITIQQFEPGAYTDRVK
jgi:hypothetical protein